MYAVEYSPKALSVIREETIRAGKRETGGLLLGYETPTGFDVLDATGPGEGFEASGTHYSPDEQVQHAQITEAEARGLCYLGEWHKHPGSLDHPSGGDIATLRRLLSAMQQIDSILVGITTSERGPPALHTFVMHRERGLLAVRQDQPLSPLAVRMSVAAKPATLEALMRIRFPEMASQSRKDGGTIWQGLVFGVPVEVVERAEGEAQASVSGVATEGSFPSVYLAIANVEWRLAEQEFRLKPWYERPENRETLRALRSRLDSIGTATTHRVKYFRRRNDLVVTISPVPGSREQGSDDAVVLAFGPTFVVEGATILAPAERQGQAVAMEDIPALLGRPLAEAVEQASEASP